MLTAREIAALDAWITRSPDDEPCAPCAGCGHDSTDLDRECMCPSCREKAEEAAELDADPAFAEVTAERHAGYLTRLEADFSADAPLPWGPQWIEGDGLAGTVAA